MAFQVQVNVKGEVITSLGDMKLSRGPTPKKGDVIVWAIGPYPPIKVKVTAVKWSGKRTIDTNEPIDMVTADEIGPA
jgi:hypothetical protein